MATGQLFRFVHEMHEMKEGDLIVYPSKLDKRAHVGESVGPYQHTTKGSDSYLHPRAVKWLKDFPRTKFTQGTRNKINLRLLDGDELVSLIVQHYEYFEAKYKGMMPIKRVYVPEPLDETQE